MFLHGMLVPIILSVLRVASSWPVASPNSFEDLAKRLDKPPIPGASDLRPHLLTPDAGECLFYTGGTLVAASAYGDDQGKFILGDMDRDGWAMPSDERLNALGLPDYAPECPLSYTFQLPYLTAGVGWGPAEGAEYWDNMSEAFAQKCNGDVYLALPPSREIPADSVFARVEFPTIQANPSISRILAVVLGTGDADGTPLSDVEVFWTRCGTT